MMMPRRRVNSGDIHGFMVAEVLQAAGQIKRQG
ncbi:hypothetical protein QFZ30_002093 [Arthrobacter pascens]|nr:hypothetical protein [Arthrobacter pascens]